MISPIEQYLAQQKAARQARQVPVTAYQDVPDPYQPQAGVVMPDPWADQSQSSQLQPAAPSTINPSQQYAGFDPSRMSAPSIQPMQPKVISPVTPGSMVAPKQTGFSAVSPGMSSLVNKQYAGSGSGSIQPIRTPQQSFSGGVVNPAAKASGMSIQPMPSTGGISPLERLVASQRVKTMNPAQQRPAASMRTTQGSIY